MNQTILSYLHLLIWPAVIIFIVLRFRTTIKYLLHERLTSIDAGGIKAEFDKATGEAIRTSATTASVETPKRVKLDSIRLAPFKYEQARMLGIVEETRQPAILDLTETDDETAKRIIDVAAGVIIALHGRIEKVAGKVFLLTPGPEREPGSPS